MLCISLKGENIVKKMPGMLLGNRYEIIENIGEGGMARVYRGVDTKLNRPVAIKILYEQFAGDPDFLRRFKQEAKAAAKLSHPSIVNVYDEGEEGNIHYIIMEYVDGFTLKDIIQRDGRLKPAEAAQIVLQICDALVHAHSQNIIHRDIKPQNIIITCEGRVKVTDFGIARAAVDATITYGKSLLGSVHYSSPEQARGYCADPKSDIYSLGVVFYELLTGAVPFSGESPISIALKHLQEDIVPPGKLVEGLPAKLENIVIKAMHKDHNLRYASAAQFRDELDEWLKSEKEVNYVNSSLVKRMQSYALYRDHQEPDEKDFEEQQEVISGKKRRSKKKYSLKKIVIYSGLFILFFAVVFIGYRFIYNFLHVPEVTMPYLIDKSIAEAEKELDSLGLSYRVVREEYNDTVPENHIISQEPPAERTVKQGREIELVLSLGPDLVEVPYLIGSTQLEARLMLSDLGLNMKVDREYSNEIAPDYVIRQDPGKGFQLARGEEVHVVVSDGKRPFSLRDFQGWELEDVREWLNLYELVLRDVDEEYSDEVPEGQVISQFPASGEMVQAGDPVDLVISLGIEPGSYKTYTFEIDPLVSRGQMIKIYVEDVEGTKIVFEGRYHGELITAEGVGSGQVVLMELKDNEYQVIDVLLFP
jgi:serine/threonine protein kinase